MGFVNRILYTATLLALNPKPAQGKNKHVAVKFPRLAEKEILHIVAWLQDCGATVRKGLHS